MKSNNHEREYDKFRAASGNLSKVAVSQDEGDSFSIFQDVKWNEIEASYPSSVQEVFTYKLNTSTVMTITINYTNSSKKFISSISKVIA